MRLKIYITFRESESLFSWNAINWYVWLFSAFSQRPNTAENLKCYHCDPSDLKINGAGVRMPCLQDENDLGELKHCALENQLCMKGEMRKNELILEPFSWRSSNDFEFRTLFLTIKIYHLNRIWGKYSRRQKVSISCR